MDFKTIDKSNYRECMELQVEESQKYFVADNTRSLVEAAYEDGLYTHVIKPFKIPWHWTRVVSFDHGYTRPFSFGVWAVDEEGRVYRYKELYGCREFLDYFKKKHGADRIYISVSLDNAVARKMYSDLGFREIKETEYSYSGHLYREMQMIKHL